jgi:hypothetical protein
MMLVMVFVMMLATVFVTVLVMRRSSASSGAVSRGRPSGEPCVHAGFGWPGTTGRSAWPIGLVAAWVGWSSTTRQTWASPMWWW